MRVELEGRTVDGITVAIQNSDPYTFFGSRPIRVCKGAGLETGTLALAVLRRASAPSLPLLLPRILSSRPGSLARSRNVEAPEPGARFRVVAEEAPLPLQVDGDYVGEVEEARFEAHPRSLCVVR